jgi:16S rRNA (guanine966-N2)-methyltransferase
LSKIRITAGDWRSRLISVTDVTGLRPTPDRVRETLFNWLGQDLTGLRCLDLFAGSGILGLEAASRGAENVVFIERDRQAYSQLQRNIDTFKDPRLHLVFGDALKCAAAVAKDMDVIFLDPPYKLGLLEKVVPLLPLIAKPDALIYAEAEFTLTALGDWKVIKQGRAGLVHYHLLAQSE